MGSKLKRWFYRRYLQVRYITKIYLDSIRVFCFRKNRSERHAIRERFGYLQIEKCILSNSERHNIWIQALSGEVCQINSFLKLVKINFPKTLIYLSTHSNATLEYARKIESVDYAFLTPYEKISCVNRVLDRIKPRVLIVVDQVRFPVILEQAKKRGVKVILISASMRDGYYKSVHMKREMAWKYFRFCDAIGVCEE